MRLREVCAMERGAQLPLAGDFLRLTAVLGNLVDRALAERQVMVARLEERITRLNRQVETGKRDQQSLFLLPVELVRSATVNFPVSPFGEPEPW